MFHYTNGLKITALDLAVDICRRQPRGFVSHAHNDHMARHELAFCTPETAALYRARLGDHRTRLMPIGEPLEWRDHRLTTYAAGHCLGSAMLHVATERGSMLYTGDFKLAESATAAPANPPPADVLVMESTYGDPRYQLPPREEVIEQLVRTVNLVLNAGRTPVIHAYVMGKSQEVTRILTQHGIPVQQHPLTHEMSEIYEKCGCSLGNFSRYEDEYLPGHVVLVPPYTQKAAKLRNLGKVSTIVVTGWAHAPRARQAHGADFAIPLSDHADYNELLACIDRVQPRIIYCTHGPLAFVDDLKRRGLDARPLHTLVGDPFRSLV
ncbi:Ribonuclease [Anatilimnocola aggregata]|uniref:Ribonuclease n=1 Tax=Anatilimnocola aggregata TaxID=2528021 RepID=A0A517Y6B6_9BACT|nr:MBL fold metallo-hydrolase RNA specificity domain-containing protein [Anatilimnocola aggregata]QDU25777.1 Ribonuclease [Anatilimnocola aggregata]